MAGTGPSSKNLVDGTVVIDKALDKICVAGRAHHPRVERPVVEI